MNIFRIFRSRSRHRSTGVPVGEVGASPAGDSSGPLRALNTMSRDDMIGACRNMAAKELKLAEGSDSHDRRATHVFNAAGWSERADVLQRIEASCRKRDALDQATAAAFPNA